MQHNQNSSAGIQINTTHMMVGAVLFGAGALLGLAGMIVGGGSLAASTRRWFHELEVPPSEVVKHKWGQTKAATTAGAQAWHASNGVHAHSGHA
jgi:hypothetical protein